MQKPRTSKITQKDVAAKAGVSQALVSQVLNGSGSISISDESRRLILEAAQSLGYHRGRKVTGSDGRKLLAYIRPHVKRVNHAEQWIFDSYEQFYYQIQELLRKAANDAGYAFMAYSDEDAGKITQWLSEWEVAGVFSNCGNRSLIEWIAQRLPLVEIDRRIIMGGDTVMVNQREMVEVAVRYLHERGYRHIDFLKSGASDYIHAERMLACEIMFAKLGLDFVMHDKVEGVLARIEALDKLGKPYALITTSHIALLLQKKLMKQGIAVPKQVSLIGIDNISACEVVYPELTSVDGQYEEVARNALLLMRERLEERAMAGRKVEISPRLIERNSVHLTKREGPETYPDVQREKTLY